MTAPDATTGDEATERVLAEVLAEHKWVEDSTRMYGMKCSCSAPWPTGWTAAAHRAHVAHVQAVALRGLPDAREGGCDGHQGTCPTPIELLRYQLRAASDALTAVTDAGHSSGGTGHDHMTAAEIQERHDLRARAARAEQQVAAVEALAAEWDDDNCGNWCGDCDRSDQLRAALAAPPTEPDNEPTALAWTSDEEIERGQAALRESHPEVWQAWLDWLAAPPTETTPGSET